MEDRKHDIEKYLRGELSGEEMHALEKEALNDPFLAEALEGIEQAGHDNFFHDLHTIRRSVHNRVGTARKKNKVIRIWVWTSSIAATLLLIAVSGFIVLNMIREQTARQQALKAERERMPVEFSKKDTLVIELPGESLAATRTRASRAVPVSPHTPTTNEPQINEADAPQLSARTLEEELSISELTTTQPPTRQDTMVAEHIAKLENTDAAQVNAKVSEQESLSRVEEKLKGRVAGVQQSASVAPSAASNILVRGKVIDADGHAVPGVNVILKDTNIGTVTNAEGQYELRIPPGYGDLMFSFIGYESSEVAIGGRPEVNVTLNEDVASLSEVVIVSGNGSADKPTEAHMAFRAAQPAGGKSDFKKYLENAVKYPAEAASNKIEGRVTVRFTVEANGQLTNFEVIKGIGSGAEEALIDAIKSGPAWTPGMQNNEPMADTVTVRYRFRLKD